MKNLHIALRSLFKKGRHNVTKIVSLSTGLAVALVLIAKIYFEQSYDTFYPNADRIYRLTENFIQEDRNAGEWINVPGGVAPGMKEEVPGVEAATRLTFLPVEANQFTTLDKRRYSVEQAVLMADSCVFDVLPRRVLSGNPKKILAQPGYAMVSRSLAETLGGIDRVEGMILIPDGDPGMRLTIAGVFEDVPENSHLRYDMLVSLEGMSERSRNNWIGNDRYQGFVLLAPGIAPESLRPAIREMQLKHIDQEEMKNSGMELVFHMKPILEMHTGSDSIRNMVVMLAILAFALLFTAVMNYILIAISSIVNRSKEIALIKSYGASGIDIHRMTMTETLLHMLISLILAVLLIFVCQSVIQDLLDVSPATLLFSKGAFILLGICVVVFLVTGFVPGFLFARIPVASAFRNFKENKRLWKLALLFLQFTSAGLLVSLLIVVSKQHRYMVDSDPGYSYDRLTYCSISGTDSATQVRIESEISKLSEVEKVSSNTCLPFYSMSGNNIKLPGSDQELFNVADQYSVGNGYLDLMEIPVVDGRSFKENIPASDEIMVSRSFVEQMKNFTDWSDGPVGKQILITGHKEIPYTICGVYENYRLGSLVSPDGRSSVLMYGQSSSLAIRSLLVKFHRVTGETMNKVNQKLKELMPDREPQLLLYSSEMANRYRDSRKFRDQVMIGGVITLIISLIGLIGYTNDEINRRRKEIAVRKINGATVGNILRIFLGDILRTAIPAVVLGCGISYYISEYWQRQFAEKIPLNPLYFIGGGLAVCLIVVACVTFRTWKIANDDPVNSLKSE